MREKKIKTNYIEEATAVPAPIIEAPGDFYFYFQVFFQALIAGAVVIIGLYLLDIYELSGSLFFFDVLYYVLAWEVIIFAYAGFRIAWQSGSYRLAARNGAIIGFFLGIIIAIFKILWFYQLWTVFNLLTEPIEYLLLGLIVSGLVASLVPKKSKL